MCKKEVSVDIIIPVYKPDEKFEHLLARLAKQTRRADHIYIMNTLVPGQEDKIEEKCSKYSNVVVVPILKENFDHGGTRNYGASLSNSEFILFMTQDAIPKDDKLMEKLLESFSEDKIAVAYGRQLPGTSAGIIEKYTREFNYPDKDHLKSKADLERLGIKTYFCSNVCAMYRKSIYDELGGFVTKTIFNEDMIMASKVIAAGYSIAYTSKAKVIHSHKYTYLQQFTRNFDLAVSQRQYQEIFRSIKSETEGIRLVKQTIKYLIDQKKPYYIPDLILQSGFKYLGFKAGYHYEKLPRGIVVKCSMNKEYWKGRGGVA